MRHLPAALLLPVLLIGQEPPKPAPVVVDGLTVLTVKASLGSFSPEVRAEAIRKRILELGDGSPEKPVDVRLRNESGLLIIEAAGQMIMAISDTDAKAEGVSQEQLARVNAEAIRRALEDYRAMHKWSNILLGAVKAAAAWAVFILVILGALRAFNWARDRIQNWFAQKAKTRDQKGLLALLWEKLLLLALLLLKLATGVFLLVQFSVLITYTFGQFPATRGISFSLLDNLLRTLAELGRAVLDYLPRGLFVAVVLIIGYYTLQIAKLVFKAIERGDVAFRALPPDMAAITYQLFRAAFLIFVLIIVFPYLPGSQSEAFKGVSIFLGVLLSLGSSSAIGNVLAGVVLTYMRAYKIGDRIQVGDQIGDVVERGLLVTRLKSIKNVEVTIPNSTILGSQVHNFSANARGLGLILHTTVTIGYDAPWRTVHELLIDAARNTEGILADPAPFVWQTALNDFNISYELNAYTNRPIDMFHVYSRLHANIQESFNRAGVEIMSPNYFALRDGNTVTTPEAHRPPDYEAPSFRLRDTGKR